MLRLTEAEEKEIIRNIDGLSEYGCDFIGNGAARAVFEGNDYLYKVLKFHGIKADSVVIKLAYCEGGINQNKAERDFYNDVPEHAKGGFARLLAYGNIINIMEQVENTDYLDDFCSFDISYSKIADVYKITRRDFLNKFEEYESRNFIEDVENEGFDKIFYKEEVYFYNYYNNNYYNKDISDLSDVIDAIEKYGAEKVYSLSNRNEVVKYIIELFDTLMFLNEKDSLDGGQYGIDCNGKAKIFDYGYDSDKGVMVSEDSCALDLVLDFLSNNFEDYDDLNNLIADAEEHATRVYYGDEE